MAALSTDRLDVFLIYRDGSTFYATLEDTNLRLPSGNFNATTQIMILEGKIVTSKLKITTTEQQLAGAVLKEDERNAYILADKLLEERDPPPGFVTRKELEEENLKYSTANQALLERQSELEEEITQLKQRNLEPAIQFSQIQTKVDSWGALDL